MCDRPQSLSGLVNNATSWPLPWPPTSSSKRSSSRWRLRLLGSSTSSSKQLCTNNNNNMLLLLLLNKPRRNKLPKLPRPLACALRVVSP